MAQIQLSEEKPSLAKRNVGRLNQPLGKRTALVLAAALLVAAALVVAGGMRRTLA